MSIVKVIEVIGTSETSFDDAARQAVKEVAQTVKNISSIYIKDMNAQVEHGQIVSFGVNAKISFRIE